MAWYSLLPPDFVWIENWLVRIFIFCGFVTIFPWASLLIFDIFLYIWRMVKYEFPLVGGRARGKQRPRAPSLNERPDGQPRVLGLGTGALVSDIGDGGMSSGEKIRRRGEEVEGDEDD
ncbi:uncharacterized protein BP01DRAFT_356488 [Aspergillus saccharolyticus JOP 1030-1]|uniref:Uncharacterized protein n=1 Tax=Aspergillus saccharolyticus JOP 1030-1 TaxID=1450539 RepID=A0A318ZGF2_9EURO|nr:hypothetical protein BP01DRAFT_356488 [Aspergillus saccharolyticus JOP 1030-1]PYH45444.1 hypothetical protein BP01DRAFT_356488 [Aspergillus saccharolyticus JOP 1030-1]